MGCGPGEGPPSARPKRGRFGEPDRSSLLSLFSSLSGMLQAPTCEQFCEKWRQLEDALFEVGSRMFGESEVEDGLSKVYEATEDDEAESLSSESDLAGID